MDMFHGALLIGAIGTAVLCRKDRRALGWIAAGAANFVVTAWYQSAGLPYHAAFLHQQHRRPDQDCKLGELRWLNGSPEQITA